MNKNSTFAFISQIIFLIIWISIIERYFIPDEKFMAVRLLLFILSVIFGIILIRNILREIKIEDEIEILVKRLHIANEKLILLDKQKTEFVSIASHQLRSPLTVVQGYTSMMLEGDFGKIPKALQDPLARISSASASLGFLISDFLNISRIEKGQLEYTFIEINLTELLDDVCKEFSLVVKNHNLILRTKFDRAVDIFVQADLGKIKQVISNVIDNAIKYTIKGYIEVDLNLKNGKALISIKDTGIGIAKGTKNKIFEKFSRTEEANRVNVYGSGLGLYVAKVMTDAQDGKIWVESAGSGKGSTFYIEFPTIQSSRNTLPK